MLAQLLRLLTSQPCATPTTHTCASPPAHPQTVTFYDSKGEFAGVRRLGSGKAMEVDGLRITPQAIVAATGLELKSDPGVPLVYAGFGGARGEERPAGGGSPLYTWRPRSAAAPTPVPPACCPPNWPAPHPAGLCVTTVVSYLSHSQVWAAQSGSHVLVGGTTNRATIFFEQELGEILEAVPELPAAPALVDGAAGGSGAQQGER